MCNSLHMTCCYQHGSCIVSDAMSGAEVMDIVDPNGALPLCAAFSGDNKWMCVGYDDGHATMFSITRGEIQKKHSMAVITPQSHNPNPQNTNPLPFTQGHKFRIIATAFDPSHEYVATASFEAGQVTQQQRKRQLSRRRQNRFRLGAQELVGA